MELMVDYENITFQVEEDNVDGYQPEHLKPGLRLQRRDPARRNVSPLIIYVLLGLCILLSSLALVMALILMTQTREIKRSDADFQMEIYQWKSNVTGTIVSAASSLSELQAEISRLRASASIFHAFDHWRFFNQRLYYFSSNDWTWDEAQKYCVARNSEFAIINSNEEQGYIRSNTNVDTWIGLHDSAVEGNWRWVDGTDYDTNVKFWADGEPNGHNEFDEDCAVVSKDGSWHDWPCNSKHPVICEKPAQ
ncbi:hepatic lectin-like isoform X2 [Amblyraja radiata]|uniref:hepatic lectin-like isoform X2 n=1 Tax=Amblyraja radiata TaxID=386614 RepID=UPI0014034798|nr:hepatic lectin-like isoform X2 [Amblyraja radiata]